MIKIVEQLTKTLREVTKHAYHEYNRQEKVVYPYITFDVSGEFLERNRLGVYLDIDVFDFDTSYKKCYELIDKVHKHLVFRRDLTDDLNLIYTLQNTAPIPTGEEKLKRINTRFYVITDERKGE